MADPKTVILVGPRQVQTAQEYIADPERKGWVMKLTPPTKRRIQEEKYHAMIGDIAKQTTYAGKRWDREDMKRILVDEFADEMRNLGKPLHQDDRSRLIPSEDGRRVIQLGIQTRDFWISEAANFITFLYAWGNARGVQWTEPVAAEPA